LSAFTWPPDAARSAAAGRAGEQIPAAVLVAMFRAGEHAKPHLVLTRRRADLRRHAGEISFPGGRKDADDADLATTALREAEEEIGLARDEVRLIGTLPTVSTFATGYVIHPYVGTISGPAAWSVSAREVDAVLELALAEIRDGLTRTQIERRGITFETDAYIVGEHLIWGATARIIAHLLERLHAPEQGPLSLGEPA
jgi:8-oxo-dGTP pyrophosphatase MutT (NUDIX family)